MMMEKRGMKMNKTAVANQTDQLLEDIAAYAVDGEITSKEAIETARYVLMDTLGCGMLALNFPECTKHLGPIVPGTVVPNGARVPGTSFVLDPVQAAFDIGCMIRWLDYNDTWLAQEWGHPSDNLGGILAVSDYISRTRLANGEEPLSMNDVLHAIVKAHEIQGVLALENCLNRNGLDHVLLSRWHQVQSFVQCLAERKKMYSMYYHKHLWTIHRLERTGMPQTQDQGNRGQQGMQQAVQ